MQWCLYWIQSWTTGLHIPLQLDHVIADLPLLLTLSLHHLQNKETCHLFFIAALVK